MHSPQLSGVSEPRDASPRSPLGIGGTGRKSGIIYGEKCEGTVGSAGLSVGDQLWLLLIQMTSGSQITFMQVGGGMQT